MALSFPPGFVWGVATSAYQIEGATRVDGRGESIWDRFCDRPGRIADGSDGSIACDHYNRLSDDVRMIAALGIGAYRFSISWPRVIPHGSGPVNHAGLDFYDRLVDELVEIGIEPFPTLYHWDLPQALQDRGGWTSRETAEAFADYAEVVTSRLGDRVSWWSTLNEPFVSADHGHVTGEHAPGITSIGSGLAAAHHLLLAHGLGVDRIRGTTPGAEVGIVVNFTPVSSASDEPDDVAAAASVHDWENRWYVDPLSGIGYPDETAERLGWTRTEVRSGDMDVISRPLDFLGVNFYTRQTISADPGFEPDPTRPTTAMGWEIHPPSLERLLVELHDRHGFPRYVIAENGAAMPDDRRVNGRIADGDRIEYLREHLVALNRAIDAGVPVDGYFVWSAFDNFEWAQGYSKRFGLIEVDYDTLARIPKASADWFAEVARTNTVQNRSAPLGASDQNVKARLRAARSPHSS